jgi:hypothetical protein
MGPVALGKSGIHVAEYPTALVPGFWRRPVRVCAMSGALVYNRRDWAFMPSRSREMGKTSLGLGVAVAMVATMARAEMISSSQARNDPEKERLCVLRALAKSRAKQVPFLIDSEYLARARSSHPEAVFIATDDGIGPQLVECYLREGTGKYEPASFSPEQDYWHLVKPPGSGIDTQEAQSTALATCEEAALSKLTVKGFDHSVVSAPFEIPLNRAGGTVAGARAERYDISVEGTAFYKSKGLDLKPAKFTCLLSRSLAVKAVQTSPVFARGRNDGGAWAAKAEDDSGGGPVTEDDVRKLWPIGGDSQKIPKFRERTMNYLSEDVEKLIDDANEKYEPDERQQVIDFCRLQAFKQKTGMIQKRRVAKSLKDPQDALLDQLQEEFMYCARGMLRSWLADEARERQGKAR